MPKFEILSKEISAEIEAAKQTGNYPPVAFADADVVRRENLKKDAATVWRPTFVHDIDKIMHCPYYNRYTDKTQVFSLCKNDDITRRSLHVQLVSRIARTIGAALHLNLDLIEAIALGHDIGHAPFGHTGEDYLDELYREHTGRRFCHNIHSVRVLDSIFPYNISLQTLNGIASHNGEMECEEYHPVPLGGFEEFDRIIERCYEDKEYTQNLMPCTLEGAVVRLADIIAYLGKDRQDAMRAKVAEESMFVNEDIGSINAEIINNLVVNVIENSYGKPYIKLDAKHFKALQKSRKDNYSVIYNHSREFAKLDTTVKPMMAEIYGQLLDDLRTGNTASPIFRHHIRDLNRVHYKRPISYEQSEPNQIVVDYIASMTDNYFIALHHHLFPNSSLQVKYKGYFSEDV
ncbi:MAG: HD domain-containing protein [Clostridia bacterium]|nr:HD domain-containing protein [Clostridia bacterium]